MFGTSLLHLRIEKNSINQGDFTTLTPSTKLGEHWGFLTALSFISRIQVQVIFKYILSSLLIQTRIIPFLKRQPDLGLYSFTDSSFCIIRLIFSTNFKDRLKNYLYWFLSTGGFRSEHHFTWIISESSGERAEGLSEIQKFGSWQSFSNSQNLLAILVRLKVKIPLHIIHSWTDSWKGVLASGRDACNTY